MKLATIFFYLLIIVSNTYCQTWNQLGNTIYGERLDYLGSRICISGDGTTIAFDKRIKASNINWSERIVVYKWNGIDWIQKGKIKLYDYAGWDLEDDLRIDMNYSGNMIVVGSHIKDKNNTQKGMVNIYSFQDSIWEQMGVTILGKDSLEHFSYDLSLSNDGKTLAVGAPQNDSILMDAGATRIFKWNGINWFQKGNDILGNSTGEKSGWSVSLSSDGNIIAIGAPLNSDNGTKSGKTKIYYWNDSAWVQKGDDLYGENNFVEFGKSISLDSIGNTIAVTSPKNRLHGYIIGLVEVFKWDGNNWIQKGDNITGNYEEPGFGSSVSLSANGKIVAFGSFDKAWIFKWCDTLWVQRGLSIDGNGNNRISDDIKVDNKSDKLIIGSPRNSENGYNSGCIKVFEYEPINSNITINTCDSLISPSNKHTFYESGNYSDTLSAYSGLDSIVNIDLTINKSYANFNEVESCNYYIWPINGKTYTESGYYGDTLINIHGCDSSNTLLLTINEKFETTDSIVACKEYFWYATGKTYTKSGSYQITFESINGCDSTLTLNLTIKNKLMSSQLVSVCYDYYWPVNGETYDKTGIYTEILESINGCDSLVKLNLEVRAINKNITYTNKGLIANQEHGEFQWLDCNNGFKEIIGETKNTFYPSKDGIYAVKIIENECIDTSYSVSYKKVITQSIFNNIDFKVYPNPTKSKLYIDFGIVQEKVNISLISISGTTLLSENYKSEDFIEIDLENLKRGFYMLKVQRMGLINILKVLKE